jgi:hypothetical protein
MSGGAEKKQEKGIEFATPRGGRGYILSRLMKTYKFLPVVFTALFIFNVFSCESLMTKEIKETMNLKIKRERYFVKYLSKAEEKFILDSSGTNNRRIWIDLYETKFDNEAVVFLLDHLITINSKILKLGLCGLSKINQWKISRKMKQKNNELFIKTKYFSDPEDAKMWLIGKFGV